jgi:hypothetical protein
MGVFLGHVLSYSSTIVDFFSRRCPNCAERVILLGLLGDVRAVLPDSLEIRETITLCELEMAQWTQW